MFSNNCQWKITFTNGIRIENLKRNKKHYKKSQKSKWPLPGKWTIHPWQWPGCAQGFPEMVCGPSCCLPPVWPSVCPLATLTNLFYVTATCVSRHHTQALNKYLFNEYPCECAKFLQSSRTLCDPMDCSPPGSSVHGLLQARILDWVAIPSSSGSSQPRDRTRLSWVDRRVLGH